MSDNGHSTTSSVRERAVVRNTAFNLGGLVAPMLAAVLATPLLVHGLGLDRFGVLTMIWAVLGSFSILDLGLGRAVTQLVAERLGREDAHEIPGLVWTANAMLLLFGVAGGLLLAAAAPWLTGNLLRIPHPLLGEGRTVFYLLALSLPWVISTSGLRGVLEANHRFDLANAIRLPLGVFTFLGPLAVLPFSRSLVPVVGILVAGRVVAWLAHLLLCFRALPILRAGSGVERRYVSPLLRFGGWMTASNVASTVMTYLDRFLIGAVISLTAVAYYVTPYEMLWRMTMLPGALLGVLFPAFAASATRDGARMARLFDGGFRAVYAVMFPATLILVTFAPELLGLWLDPGFASHSATVLQWLAVGVFALSLGMVLASGLQGIGRPDLTGQLNLIELPLYIGLLWLLLHRYGIVGAAIAWTARAAVDAVALGLFFRRVAAQAAPSVDRGGALLAASLPIFWLAASLRSTGAKCAFIAIALLSFVAFVWWIILQRPERRAVRSCLAGARVGAIGD
jgi:O-antigen/teichoic acid export membrane protein